MRVPCQVAANLLTDDVLMRSYQLTPEYRPLVDLHSDLAPTQGNKGWFFGYSDALLGSTATFRAFKYEAHGNGQLQDGRWMVREVGLLPGPSLIFSQVLKKGHLGSSDGQ